MHYRFMTGRFQPTAAQNHKNRFAVKYCATHIVGKKLHKPSRREWSKTNGIHVHYWLIILIGRQPARQCLSAGQGFRFAVQAAQRRQHFPQLFHRGQKAGRFHPGF